MHELAVMAQSIDEMKVNIAWITECFCSGVIVVNEFKVDNKLIFVTTNCLRFYEHELLEIFTNTNRANATLSLQKNATQSHKC